MLQENIPVDTIVCGNKNYIEIGYWKKRLLQKKPIPSPWINEKREVIAFHSCFFALKEMGFTEIQVAIPNKNERKLTRVVARLIKDRKKKKI